MRFYGIAQNFVWCTASLLLGETQKGNKVDFRSMGAVYVNAIQSMGRRTTCSVSAHKRIN